MLTCQILEWKKPKGVVEKMDMTKRGSDVRGTEVRGKGVFALSLLMVCPVRKAIALRDLYVISLLNQPVISLQLGLMLSKMNRGEGPGVFLQWENTHSHLGSAGSQV